MPRCLPLGDQAFDGVDDLIGVAGAPDAHVQSLRGVFVDDVQQLQPLVISGLVELKVDSPHVVGALGPGQLAARGPAAFALARRWAAQAPQSATGAACACG